MFYNIDFGKVVWLKYIIVILGVDYFDVVFLIVLVKVGAVYGLDDVYFKLV